MRKEWNLKKKGEKEIMKNKRKKSKRKKKQMKKVLKTPKKNF